MKRWLLLLFATVVMSSAFAQPAWNESTLSDSAQQVADEINQAIAGKNPWQNDGIDAENFRKIREIMRFKRTPQRYETLLNRQETLGFIVDEMYWMPKARIPYLYQIHQLSEGSVYLNSGIELYKAILSDDSDSAPFAFAGLHDLRKHPQWEKTDEEKYAELQSLYGFNLDDIYVDRDQDAPQICLNFSLNVRSKPAESWAQYVHISPDISATGRYQGNELCYSGQYQQEYSISLDAALQSQNLLHLGREENRVISSGNRNPMVRFAQRGKTLNLDGARQLAISSSNVDQIDVALWLIPANNLANTDLTDALDNPQGYGEFTSASFLNRHAGKRYEGHFNVSGEPNSLQTSNLLFDDMVAADEQEAGIYVLHIQDHNADDYEDPEVIGFTASRYGMTAYRSDDGLWVEVRDLSSTQPIAGQTITLYSYSNAVLGTATTDDNGMAQFSRAQVQGEAGDRLSHVLALDGQNLTYLSLRGSGFDLSDKGLEGVYDNAPLAHWSWLERGVYRPDDTLHALWLVKKDNLEPYNETPLWLTLRRPDGAIIDSCALPAGEFGRYSYEYTFSPDANQGEWVLELSLGEKGALISRDTVMVDAIIPQQIEARLESAQTPHAGHAFSATLQADWLYGAPAEDLLVSGEYLISAADLENPAWQDWQIGLHDERVDSQSHDISNGQTDSEGQFTIHIDRLSTPSLSKPLQLGINSRVQSPSGQAIPAYYRARIEREAPYIALKTENSTASIAAINDQGELSNANVTLNLYRLHYSYYWYRDEGGWHYQENTTREAIKDWSLSLDGKAAQQIALPLDDGSYLLEALGESSESAASMRLSFGRWQSDNPQDSGPERIAIESDKTHYQVGETVKLRLQAPFDGLGSVHIATDGIIETQTVTFKDGMAELSLPWRDDWQRGIWLLASGWNAEQNAASNQRAVGLLWLGDGLSAQTLSPSIEAPAEVNDPRQPFALSVRVPDAPAGTQVNIAVIDDGLYQLARETFSDPLQAFFGKKRLNLTFFDLWGAVIRQIDARQAALRSGAGDKMAAAVAGTNAALPDVDVDLISHWSGPITVDDRGVAHYSIDVPQDFNGRLRIMAAAFNATQLGYSQQTSIIKAPLVSTLYTPRYVNEGDQGSISLRLHNTTGDTHTYRYTLLSDGGMQFSHDPAVQEITLGADERQTLNFPFTVRADSGEIHLTADISSDSRDYRLKRRLSVRPLSLPQRQQRYLALAAGSQESVDVGDSATLSVQRIPWARDDVHDALSAYPYYCSEQTSAKLSGALLAGEDREPLNALIARLQNRQNYDGGFSLWGNSSSEWGLSAFASDMLWQGEHALERSSASLKRALDYLQLESQRFNDNPLIDSDITYTHYVLARADYPNQGALIRYSEQLSRPLPDSAATYELALALLSHGERERALAVLNSIESGVDEASAPYFSNPLNRGLRTLMRLHQLTAHPTIEEQRPLHSALLSRQQQLEARLMMDLNRVHTYDTQSLAWMAQISALLPNDAADSIGEGVQVNGQALSTQSLSVASGAQQLRNNTQETQYLTINELVHFAADETIGEGFSIDIHYQDEQGNALAGDALPLNQSILAQVSITRDEAESDHSAQIIFVYPFAAGMSAPTLREGNTLSAYQDSDWYDALDWPDMQENRDDRHIAAFYMDSGQTSLNHAFIVRTTRAGTWHAPGYSVENMYDPAQRVRYPAQQWNIGETAETASDTDSAAAAPASIELESLSQ